MNKRPIGFILLSSGLFGLSAPLAKILLRDLSPLVLSGLLYFGAFLGLTIYALLSSLVRPWPDAHDPPLRKADWPWLAGAILSGGLLGPICLLAGLSRISGSTASLLLNLEGVTTALIAVIVFKESAGRRIWAALFFMTSAGVVLSWDPGQGKFQVAGSLLVLAGMIGWGLDNNFTRNIADKNPIQIARIKGFVAGSAALLFGALLGQRIPFGWNLLWGMLLGALSYGASLVLYIKALRGLGAFRAGSFFSVAPFIGALASLVLLSEPFPWVLVPGAILMILGLFFLLREEHRHHHGHEAMTHAHSHTHTDGHHLHDHDSLPAGPHSHEHVHEDMDHVHVHWPDTHHRHPHKENS